MKHGICFLLLSLVSSVCFGLVNFSGTYKCKGNDPYLKQDYAGTVKITQQNAVYQLEMNYGDEHSIGTGGQFDQNTLAVVFQNVKKPKLIGLERYAVSDDHNVIYGYWVYLGKDKLGKEICEKVS